MKTGVKRFLSMSSIMILTLLMLASSVVMYQYIVKEIVHLKHDTISQIKEEEYDKIYVCLEQLKDSANIQVTDIAKNIEKDLLESDLDQLKEDLDNGVENKELNDILFNNINGKSLNGINNRRNGIMVMSTDCIIEDFNLRRSDSKNRTFEQEIENAYNKELADDGIDKIINRTNHTIAFEPYNMISGEHIKISELNYNTLKKVYMKEGFEGLRNYQICVPYYITDVGDIFGEPDIKHGVRQTNHKIIIIQEFNLYDQIEENYKSLFVEDRSTQISNTFTSLINAMYIFGIVLVISVAAILLYYCTIHNHMYDMNGDSHDDEHVH